MSCNGVPSTAEELLKCPNCCKFYEDPVCLPCGHSLCSPCLNGIVKRNLLVSSITCDVCGHRSLPEIDTYPRNVLLQKICEYLTESTDLDGTNDSEIIFCGKHGESVIDRFCLVCRKLVCKDCETDTAHNGHAIASLNDEDNRAQAFSRVEQYCRENIAYIRKKLQVNATNQDRVRNCIASTEEAFRLLENKAAEILREVFPRMERAFQEVYRKAEVSCIEEKQRLEDRLTMTKTLLENLTSAEKLSELHHTLAALDVIPESVTSVSGDALDSYSMKLEEKLNEALDECINFLKRIKSPSRSKDVKKQAACVGSKTLLRSENGTTGTCKNVARAEEMCSCAASSPLSQGEPSFQEFLGEFSGENNEENEVIIERFVEKDCSMESKISFIADENTGEKFYVGVDEVLDVKTNSSVNESSQNVSNDSIVVISTDSRPDIEVLSSMNCPYSLHNPVVLKDTFGSRGKGNGEFNKPKGLAVNTSGKLYVADSCNNRIQVFNENLEFLSSFGEDRPGLLRMPLNVTIHPTNNAVIVADSHNNQLQFFSECGEFLEKVGKKGDASAGCFQVPSSLAVNSKGHVIVADKSNHRIHVVTPSGIEDSMIFGKEGGAVLEFRDPACVAVDEEDKIFVADCGNNRIQVLCDTGEFLFSFGEEMLSMPSSIAVSPKGNILVADSGNNQIKVFDRKGNFLLCFGSEGTTSTIFKGPGNFAWLPNGQLVISDVFHSKLRLFECPY